MELFDVLGYGVCHREPARTMADAWLCYRCSGLYAGGLLGVLVAGWFDRRLGVGVQVMVCGLLLAPIAIDTQFFGRGSPFDVGWWRLVSGALAGVGSGLFFGARAVRRVAWPSAARPLVATAAVWGPLLIALAVVLRGFGVAAGLDLAVGAGLTALCFAGTAWGLAVARWLVNRLTWLRLEVRPFSSNLLAAVVVAELVAVSLIPNQYKPSGLWLRPVLELLGLR